MSLAVLPGCRSRRKMCRSGMIRPWLLVLAAVIFLPVLYIGGRQVVGDRARAGQIVQLLTDLEAERTEAFRASGGGAAYMEQIQRSTGETMSQIADLATGDTPMDIIGRTLVKTYEGNRADEIRYAELVREAEQNKTFDGTNARSAQELDRRIRSVEEMIRATTNISNSTDQLPGEVRRELQRVGAEKEEIDRLMTEFVRGFSSASALEVMRLEIQILELGRDNLALLRDAWGQWTVQGGQVVFNRNRDAERFNAIQTDLQRAIDGQVRLMSGR